MKRLYMTLFVMLITFVGMAQTKDDVTLTVTGDGATKEEAVDNALRSAIAQAYGVFVSANTQILNDEVVKDEISAVTSGNIKEYKEVAIDNLSNGKKEVTVRATVSISKLINYAKSKGAATEFAGATFARNMKIWELNKANEKEAICNELHKMKLLLPSCYDRNLVIYDPKVNGEWVVLPMRVDFIPNQNFINLLKSYLLLLKSLSLSDNEIEECDRNGIEYYTYTNYILAPGDNADSHVFDQDFIKDPMSAFYVWYYKNFSDFFLDDYFDDSVCEFHLRNGTNYIADSINTIYARYIMNLAIQDNLGNMSKINKDAVDEWKNFYYIYADEGADFEIDVDGAHCTGLFNTSDEECHVSVYDLPLGESHPYSDTGASVYWQIAVDSYRDNFHRDSPDFDPTDSGMPCVLFELHIPLNEINKYSKFELVN